MKWTRHRKRSPYYAAPSHFLLPSYWPEGKFLHYCLRSVQSFSVIQLYWLSSATASSMEFNPLSSRRLLLTTGKHWHLKMRPYHSLPASWRSCPAEPQVCKRWDSAASSLKPWACPQFESHACCESACSAQMIASPASCCQAVSKSACSMSSPIGLI